MQARPTALRPVSSLALAALLTLAACVEARAQGDPSVSAEDVAAMKLHHYFTPDDRPHDADFSWAFTEGEFAIKKGKGPIPPRLIDALLPEAVACDEIRGRWKLGGGKLVLTEIRSGGVERPGPLGLRIYSTGGTVVRVEIPEQYVFGIGP